MSISLISNLFSYVHLLLQVKLTLISSQFQRFSVLLWWCPIVRQCRIGMAMAAAVVGHVRSDRGRDRGLGGWLGHACDDATRRSLWPHCCSHRRQNIFRVIKLVVKYNQYLECHTGHEATFEFISTLCRGENFLPIYQAERREREEGLGGDGKLNGAFVLGLGSIRKNTMVD